jgi:hypothetical protein
VLVRCAGAGCQYQIVIESTCASINEHRWLADPEPQVPMIGSSSGAFVTTFAACGVDVDEAAVRAVQLFDHYKVGGTPPCRAWPTRL